ncbi:cytochrome c oxidase assembly protein [Cryobacterium sp. MLB-32]|uniref:cytochrome c oxidase assembly protein n=1 Tax=Cryobacterium sp. MLB-32 TaxID=1529318 RepID=UPI00056D794F|nr:cytochrome c oxidase assembly protein [Cryobacterium sp. MLB-32]
MHPPHQTSDETRFESRILTVRAPTVIPVVLALCVPLAVALSLLAMIVTDAFSGLVLIDPGDLVTHVLPIARVVHDGAAAVTIGLLVLATFALPGQSIVPGRASYSQWRAARWAVWSASVWAAAGLAVLVFTTANALGVPVSSSLFATQFFYVATELDLGRTLLLSVGCVVTLLVILLVTTRVSWIATATVLSILALLPLALSGHAAGSDEHGNAVNSMAIHLVGVTVWVGGLVALLVMRKHLGTALPVVVARYSVFAGWAFLGVVVSGAVNAGLRLASPADLLHGYGLLVLSKSVILVLLGVAGYWHRKRILPRLVRAPSDTRAFARLAVVEVVLMAAAIGLSVGLSRSAPPVSQASIASLDVRRALIGFPFPEPMNLFRMLTSVHVDMLFLSIAVLLACFYIAGVVRLRRRGDFWPWNRTVAWVAGCLTLIYFTSGGPGVYGAASFSTHMLLHMGLMMFIPPLLVLGGPVLLALRVLPKRHDDSRGPREWILIIVHSRYLRLLSHPVVAGVLFAGSLVAFYYTGWFEYSLRTHAGHVLMCVHFLASGYVFFWVLIGIDPGPKRPSHPLRLILLIATLAFHAFFGLSIMSGTEVLAIDWWHALQFTDDAALLADQRIGGGVAWGAGEFPTVLAALVLMRQWLASDERLARRLDRKADQNGDADLRSYNDNLAALNRRDNGAHS